MKTEQDLTENHRVEKNRMGVRGRTEGEREGTGPRPEKIECKEKEGGREGGRDREKEKEGA
jgi:hypothetical protein